MPQFTLMIHIGRILPAWAQGASVIRFNASDRVAALRFSERHFSHQIEEFPDEIDRAELCDADGAIVREGQSSNA
ncbi:MAG TPA: hypothetical protein VLJ17_20630 [Xanthobacteraceae bacterium]|nr:hypothetical protein [Xanthobacteraceae bacterium]